MGCGHEDEGVMVWGYRAVDYGLWDGKAVVCEDLGVLDVGIQGHGMWGCRGVRCEDVGVQDAEMQRCGM